MREQMAAVAQTNHSSVSAEVRRAKATAVNPKRHLGAQTEQSQWMIASVFPDTLGAKGAVEVVRHQCQVPLDASPS
jgi:hypothetical protein